VAILPELDEVEAIELNPADLRVDTFRAPRRRRSAREQNRFRHPHHSYPHRGRGRCQDERTQHKNRSRPSCRSQITALAAEREKQQSQQAQSRKLQVGSGAARSAFARIIFHKAVSPTNRINLTLYKLDDVMNGNLDELVRALNQETPGRGIGPAGRMTAATQPMQAVTDE